jgi:hypothetical protein
MEEQGMTKENLGQISLFGQSLEIEAHPHFRMEEIEEYTFLTTAMSPGSSFARLPRSIEGELDLRTQPDARIKHGNVLLERAPNRKQRGDRIPPNICETSKQIEKEYKPLFRRVIE